MNLINKFIKIKILMLLFIIISIYFVSIGCTFNKEYDNVFIVYLDGANNLDQFALNDFNEIKNLSSKYIEQIDENSVVLVLFDRMYNDFPSYEDWEDTRLYEIKYKNAISEVKEIDCSQLGLTTLYIDEDCDMGSAKTLGDLCSFALNNYPATRYLLDIWNHGGGWRKSKEICSDEESGSVISMIEIRNELLKIPYKNSGLSIYFPKYPLYDKYFSDYTKDKVYFCSRYSNYLSFLTNFSMNDLLNIDNYEPNGKKEYAYNISFPFNINSYIWCENDLDYYKLLNIPVNGFKIRLIPATGHDFDLKVYYYIDDSLYVLQSTNNNDMEEQIEIDANIASKINELYIVVVGANFDFCQDAFYNLTVE